MQQGYELALNRDQPIRRRQEVPLPTVVASGLDISGLQDEIDDAELIVGDNVARIAALEGSAPIAHAAMQLTNTDIVTDVNTASLTVVPLASNTSFGTGFTQVGSSVQADFDGVVRISANIYLTSAIKRSAVAVEFFKNTASLGVRHSTSLMMGSGHILASTACPAFLASCSDGDTFDIRSIQDGLTGLTTMAVAGGTFLQVERVA